MYQLLMVVQLSDFRFSSRFSMFIEPSTVKVDTGKEALEEGLRFHWSNIHVDQSACVHVYK